MTCAASREFGYETGSTIVDRASKDAVATLEKEFSGGRAYDLGRNTLRFVGYLPDVECLEVDGIHLLYDTLGSIARQHVG